MSTYIKKPIQVEAFQWTGDRDQVEDPEWIIEALKNKDAYFDANHLWLCSANGDLCVNRGDYIIKYNDELYPCNEETFSKVYEKIEAK